MGKDVHISDNNKFYIIIKNRHSLSREFPKLFCSSRNNSTVTIKDIPLDGLIDIFKSKHDALAFANVQDAKAREQSILQVIYTGNVNKIDWVEVDEMTSGCSPIKKTNTYSVASVFSRVISTAKVEAHLLSSSPNEAHLQEKKRGFCHVM